MSLVLEIISLAIAAFYLGFAALILMCHLHDRKGRKLKQNLTHRYLGEE